jgi:acetyl-CoA acetyltransferase
MRDVAVIGYAQSKNVRSEKDRNEVEMLMPVIEEAVAASGMERTDIGFTCSGSTDYLSGQSFAFVAAVDAVGAWPPIVESHVEMDGAWALYESWVKIQCGEIDSALIFSFGRSSMGETAETLILQTDPYTMAPLGPDAISMAALQARVGLDKGLYTERDMAEVAVANRRHAKDNPDAQLAGDFDVDALLAEPYLASPLRKHDCPPITDGCAAMVIAASDTAKQHCSKPAWIRAIEHRYDSHQLGGRDLSVSPSTAAAGKAAGIDAGGFDFAELHAPFTHQELIVKSALGLADDVTINPSGGPLAANPIMTAGLARIGESFRQIQAGRGRRGVAHATSGPCLQQNLVCILEGED